ncbi:MAG: UDP-N-acetylglucosamine 2-epimerase (hydrolyzing) [Phycisphaerales bacterium]|nr:UDP-N-acetylglucosamine 2-epimerase (hydrolyzing) [Phycisphaerales bacterium]
MSDDGQNRAGRKRRVLVVTGTRAEFGLLRPVMKAVQDRGGVDGGEDGDLELLVVAAGSHLVQPALTFHEVKAEFAVADSIPMQTAGRVGRAEDVEAVGKGIGRFGRSFELLDPDWVVVLGDRIEAFAAASAASIGGRALAHIHGGDRAEGVADEAMRHAITKMANVHFPATEGSAERIVRMGEDPERVFTVGSPAIDGLGVIPALGDGAYADLGGPEVVVLMHPCGRGDDVEREEMRLVLKGVEEKRVLVLAPNLDPGRRGIIEAIQGIEGNAGVVVREHLERDVFVGLLRRVGEEGGALVGNSSAGLIECSALGCPSVDVGIRQSGRERCAGMTVHVESGDGVEVRIQEALRELCSCVDRGSTHPYGDGTAGVQIARVLAGLDPSVEGFVRKRCVY